LSVTKTTKTAEFKYWLFLSFANYSKIEYVMTMMQYTNCVVKAHKVQAGKLRLQVQILMTCPVV